MSLSIGTKSLIFGAHCFFLHPLFVAAAWTRLYGFPLDPRLLFAFFLHDIGYAGLPNLDGPEGETHPITGAWWMSFFFDRDYPKKRFGMDTQSGDFWFDGYEFGKWGRFTLLHSRYYAKTLGAPPSRLCMADKLAIALTPAWLYLPMVRATGEIDEYMAHSKHRLEWNTNVRPFERARLLSTDAEQWYAGVQSYCRRWALAHKDGAADTWTSDSRHRAVLEHGVWK